MMQAAGNDEERARDPLLQQLGSNVIDHGSSLPHLSAMTYAQARTVARLHTPTPTPRPWLATLATALANFCHRLTTRRALLPLKAGTAACIASSLRFIPGSLSFLTKKSAWAVITSDIVLEPTAGVTLSKGINRTLGTLVAAALALGVDRAAPSLGWLQPYFLMLCTFLGGAIPTAFKFRRPFSDRWNYAVVMSMITFHLLILSKSDYSEKKKLPVMRMLMIVFGFVIASFVNLLLAPEYAGDAIHAVLSKNFIVAGCALEKCVKEYCKGKVLQQIPHEYLGNGRLSSHDDLQLCFHQILSADSEVDKLRATVKFEPCHGKFFWRYPWYMYEDVTDNLRHLLYDVVALDSCLRAEIQAPMHLRNMFQDDFLALASECAQILQTVGESIKYMKRYDCKPIVLKAEESSLLLQHKITQRMPTILKGSKDPYSIQLSKNNPQVSSLHGGQGRPESESMEHLNNQIIEASPPSSLHETVAPEQSTGSGHPEEKGHQTLASRAIELQKNHSGMISTLESKWDIVADRLSALSIVKFASILIGLVAKSKYVVEVVDQLAVNGRFDEVPFDHVGVMDSHVTEKL